MKEINFPKAKAFGDYLNETFRKKAEVARAAKVTPHTLCRQTLGYQRISEKLAFRYAKALNIDPMVFVNKYVDEG